MVLLSKELIIEKIEFKNGFKVIVKKPLLSEAEYIDVENSIVKRIINILKSDLK